MDDGAARTAFDREPLWARRDLVVPLSGEAVTEAIVIGKLPFHGDFVARGLNADARDRLDKWLASSMAIAREQLGAKFDETFDVAPPWRFAWNEDRWTAGALVASIDASGRRFPLVAARCNLDKGQVQIASALCEELASEAIAMRWSADELAKAVEGADIARDDTHCVEGWWNEELGEPKLNEKCPSEIVSHVLASAIGAAA
jgi:type VI secretion system protein ImpM